MKLFISILYSSFIFIGISDYCNAQQPFDFNTPNGWEVEYNNQGDIHHYSFIYHEGKSALLMFSNMPGIDPTNISEEQTETINYLQDWAQSRLNNNQSISRFENKKIIGTSFYGTSTILFHDKEFIQVLFSIRNETIILIGQFTGPEKRWEEAINIKG